ncbi:MAG: hypothetical protein ACREUI_09855 [Burkholderiales bacterium]
MAYADVRTLLLIEVRREENSRETKKAKTGKKGKKRHFWASFAEERKVDNSFNTKGQRVKGSKGQRPDLVDFP